MSMISAAREDAGDRPRDAPVDPIHEANGAQRSKKEQRRLAKAQYRMQQKAARAEAIANGDDMSAFRQRKRRSQRDCNRQGALKQRLLTAGITGDSGALDRAPAKQRSPHGTPQVTYVPCTSRTCGSSGACCLRVVAPYIHRFETFAKARWCGRTLRDVFSSDFAGLPADYCPRAIAAGLIRINGERRDAAYVIRNGDLLTHTVHRHEPPVHLPVCSTSTTVAAAAQALVQYETDDVVVVDKPSSLPVHPSGAYLHNAVTEVLETECSVPELFPVHRLDRLTSGLLLFAKSPAKARELCDAIASGDVQKHYVARVVGTFPPAMREDAERVDFSHVDCSDTAQLTRVELDGAMYWKLSAPIGCISSAAHRQGVTRGGNSKDAVTLFRLLSTSGAHSVVECLPITGRTHQIRVHLQFLGFAIANDPEYGPERGATEAATTDRSEDRRSDDRSDEETQDAVRAFDTSTLEPSDGVVDEQMLCKAICPACRDGDDSIFSATQREVFTLWLHSFKYTSSKWAFEVPLPHWASN